jgi:carbamoyl-phosphate synthase large subunit
MSSAESRDMGTDWKTKSIAVTGLGAGENPAPGVAVARSLRDGGHTGRLIGLAYDTMDAGLYNKDIFDEIYMIPYPNKGSSELLDKLKSISSLDLVLPTLDSEMELYISIEEDLQESGIACFLPESRALALRTKSRLVDFCKQHSFKTPDTIVIHEYYKLEEAWDELKDPDKKQPVWVKGVFYEAEKASSLADVQAAFLDISSRWGLPIILQRGLEGFEYNVCCLGDGKGELIGSVAMRKMGVSSKGKAWSGITISEPRLHELSRKMISAMKWRGPCEIEILCEDKTNELYLIEINPRFPAWCYLCVGAGQNLPMMQAKLAFGEDVSPLQPARSGVIYSRAAVDIICDLDTLEELVVDGRTTYEEKMPQNISRNPK